MAVDTEEIAPPEADAGPAGDVAGVAEAATQDTSPEMDPFDRAVSLARKAQSEAPAGDSVTEAITPVEAEAEVPVQAEKPLTPQQVLDRVRTLSESGRESELSPQERGVLNRIKTQAVQADKAAAAEEQSFKDLFLRLDEKAQDEPETFVRELLEEPNGERLLSFYRKYKADHPDLSVDNPNGVGQEDPVKLKASIAKEWFDHFDAGIESVALAAGLDQAVLTKLYDESNHPFNDYLPKIVDALAEKKAESRRGDIRAEERKAAELEAQAKWSSKTIIAPRSINGSAGPDKSASRPPSDPGAAFDWAATRAREAIAS